MSLKTGRPILAVSSGHHNKPKALIPLILSLPSLISTDLNILQVHNPGTCLDRQINSQYTPTILRIPSRHKHPCRCNIRHIRQDQTSRIRRLLLLPTSQVHGRSPYIRRATLHHPAIQPVRPILECPLLASNTQNPASRYRATKTWKNRAC